MRPRTLSGSMGSNIGRRTASFRFRGKLQAQYRLPRRAGCLPNQHVRILSDSGAIAPDDSVGEIAIQSDCLFTGYYNRPDLTAEAFLDGWYRTGDLGFLFDGELYVVGRKKDLLIVGGENIYPQDIEEIVGAHPAIHDGRAIAMGIYNPEIGTEDIVVVAEVEKQEMLAQTCRNRTADSQQHRRSLGHCGEKDLSRRPEMDREEHRRKTGSIRHPGETIARTSRAVTGIYQSMTPESQQMIEYIVQLTRKPGLSIDENTPLVSSGLIDSMALVDLLLKLEDLTNRRIPAGKVQPKDMDTVAKMFATAERVGKPRR